jgi:predicted PhzF superfamily epimerase YddE/YHI9
MRLQQFQVDAFARRTFEGNPAAVCPLERWLNDDVLQAIAGENNLSETAFFVRAGRGLHLRWFTPVAEVDLCGHATLAAAHVVFELLGYEEQDVRFDTRSGVLTVVREGTALAMDFPARPPAACAAPPSLLRGLRGAHPVDVLAADDYVVVLADESAVRTLAPDYEALKTLDRRGLVVTAPGRDVDFVSRFFAPALGVPEDPVTGSAHCELAVAGSGAIAWCSWGTRCCS